MRDFLPDVLFCAPFFLLSFFFRPTLPVGREPRGSAFNEARFVFVLVYCSTSTKYLQSCDVANFLVRASLFFPASSKHDAGTEDIVKTTSAILATLPGCNRQRRYAFPGASQVVTALSYIIAHFFEHQFLQFRPAFPVRREPHGSAFNEARFILLCVYQCVCVCAFFARKIHLFGIHSQPPGVIL